MPNVNECKNDETRRKEELNKSRREIRQYYGFGVLSAKEIKVCAECGAICKASESRCGDCGADLPKKNLYELSVEDVRHCQHCGAILVGSENYCPICGKSLMTAK